MNHTTRFVFGLVGLLVVGCTSTPTRVDTGPIKAMTFDFVTASPAKTDFSENDAAVHAVIQSAIADHLSRKGLARVEGGGDVKVAYLLIVGNNVTTRSVNDYFGYGRDADALVEKAHKASAVDNQNPDYYEAGAMVIDIIDAGKFTLLQRSFVVRPLLRDASPDVREARIRDAVDEALHDLRIAQ